MAIPNKDISNTKSKKMKGHPQKGMIWGSNSPSLNKRKTQEGGGFGDFGRYMAEKKRKLSLQFQADANNKDMSAPCTNVNPSSGNDELSINVATRGSSSSCTDLSKLLRGISIFVNGFTVPSHQELRSLMLKHGGTFENYFSRDAVTHIICSTLPDSKIKDHRSFSRGLPIVKPSWIVDSISCGKVLPISLYSHERIALCHPNQRTLSAFLDGKDEDNCKHPCPLTSSSKTLLSLQRGMLAGKQRAVQDEANSDPSEEEDFSLDYNLDRYSDLDAVEMYGSNPLEDRGGGSSSDSVRSHSTLGDANFVQNFFKNSRLHFIGTWRTRYQNRFGGAKLDKGEQDQPTNVPAFIWDGGDRMVMHVDMDCFFVSVVVRNRPDLVGKPVAVCHSEKSHGTAEISSSNYAARAFGVKSGMFIRDAKALCPDLEIVPYDFEGYEQVADQFYDVLHKYCKKVQAISCDEAYLDVTGVLDPELLASTIRKEIVDLTRCTASVGIARNLLLARMATCKAKPDGLYKINPEDVEGFLSSLAVEDLPGVGWSLQDKLHNRDIYNCKQLRAISKENLQRDFGTKTGEMLWCYARGIDNRQVQGYQERKSIGAEVNWGVRFKSISDAHHFLTSLCGEVAMRLQGALVCGRTFTLKIKKRKEGAGEPEKFMGCGNCDNLSKSVTLGMATNNTDVLLRVSRQIFASIHLDVREIRGMGLQVTKLEPSNAGSMDQGQQQQKDLLSCLHLSPRATLEKDVTKTDSSASASKEGLLSEADAVHLRSKEDDHGSVPWGLDRSQDKQKKGIQSLWKVLKGPFSGVEQKSLKKAKHKQKLNGLPNFLELDCSVLASLPPEILGELDEAYGGAVGHHLSSYQNAGVLGGTLCVTSMPPTNEALPSLAEATGDVRIESGRDKGCPALENVPTSSSLESTGLEERPSVSVITEQTIPLSLSQVDMAILEELPAQVREDILNTLPVHRQNSATLMHDVSTLRTVVDVLSEGMVEQGADGKEDRHEDGALNLEDLWCGSPPKWQTLFMSLHGPGTEMLRLLAVAFSDSGCPENFSSVLLHVLGSHNMCDRTDQYQVVTESVVFKCCLGLLKQYLTSKVSSNLEEVYTTIRVLRRLASGNYFWEEVCALLVPFAQAATAECYGGVLHYGG